MGKVKGLGRKRMMYEGTGDKISQNGMELQVLSMVE